MPQRVAGALAGLRIAAIAGGHKYSAAITVDGALYTWGQNNYGQLGLGDRSTRDAPVLVALPVPGRVLTVACGVDHTLIVIAGALACSPEPHTAPRSSACGCHAL